jgi:hypothetical protein
MEEKRKPYVYDCKSVGKDDENEAMEFIRQGYEYVCTLNPNTLLFRKKREWGLYRDEI